MTTRPRVRAGAGRAAPRCRRFPRPRAGAAARDGRPGGGDRRAAPAPSPAPTRRGWSPSAAAAPAGSRCPVQVDERAMVNLGKVYPPGSGPRLRRSSTPIRSTFTGADPDPKVDANDELALMWRDTGARARVGHGSAARRPRRLGRRARARGPAGRGEALGLPLRGHRPEPRSGRRQALRGLPLRAALRRLPDDLQDRPPDRTRRTRRCAPRPTRRASPTAGSRTSCELPPAAPRAPTCSTVRPSSSTRPACGISEATFSGRRRSVHRQQDRSRAGDPLVRRRQQRALRATRQRLLRRARGGPHLRPRALRSGA